MNGRSALVVSDAALLWLLHPEATRACRELGAPREWLLREGGDRVAVTVAATGLWCVAAWVGLAVLAAVAARLPGVAGRVAGRFVSVALPVVLRRVVIGSAGLGIVLAPMTAAGMAAADVPDGPGGRPVAAAPHSAGDTPLPGPSWPGSGDDPTASGGPAPAWPAQPSAPGSATPGPARPAEPRPSLSAPAERSATPGPAWPAPSERPVRPPATASGAGSSPGPVAPISPPQTAGSPAPTARPPASSGPPVAPARPTPPPRTTTVHADDSLWLLGARRLGPHASDAEIAAYLPDLYHANRDVIGDDPDLIRPGQQLTLPAPDSATRVPGANPP